MVHRFCQPIGNLLSGSPCSRHKLCLCLLEYSVPFHLVLKLRDVLLHVLKDTTLVMFPPVTAIPTSTYFFPIGHFDTHPYESFLFIAGHQLREVVEKAPTVKGQ